METKNGEKCRLCGNIIIKDPIKDWIPGGIRGHGPSHTVFFCSSLCQNSFLKTETCQTCKCHYDYELINGFRVCSDDSSYMGHPTCKEKYTGNYLCNTCDKIQNVNQNKCFYFQDDDDDEYYYLCNFCVQPFNLDKYQHQFYRKDVEKWIHVYDNDIKQILKLKNLSEKYCFICNQCNTINDVKKGIFIHEKKNLCDNCFKNIE